MKKIQNIADLAPVGRDLRSDFHLYVIGLGIAFLFSCTYFVNLFGNLQAIATGTTSTMSEFSTLLGWSLHLFPLLAIFSLSFVFFYFQMHCGSAKTLYLMRRLPDRWSLYRRCLTLPILFATLTLAIAGTLLLIYYIIYCGVTPGRSLL